MTEKSTEHDAHERRALRNLPLAIKLGIGYLAVYLALLAAEHLGLRDATILAWMAVPILITWVAAAVLWILSGSPLPARWRRHE